MSPNETMVASGFAVDRQGQYCYSDVINSLVLKISAEISHETIKIYRIFQTV